jgi:hypothetical protein
MKTLMHSSIPLSCQSHMTAGGAYWPTLVQATPIQAKRIDARFNGSIEGSSGVLEGCSVS